MKDKYPPKCPTTITPAIRQFALELGGASEPEYIEVHPQPFAEQSRCYDNCFLAQQLFGGEPVLGFIIWSTNDVMLTAEHHCVLRGRSDGGWRTCWRAGTELETGISKGVE